MTPEQLQHLLLAAVSRASSSGALPVGAAVAFPVGPLLRPTTPRPSGVVADWVTPVAQRWSAALGGEPRARSLARTLADGLLEERDLATVEVTPTGLLALTLVPASRARIVEVVLDAPESYAALPGRRHRAVLERAGWCPLDDPLRSVQLAHARLCRLVRNAAAVGVERGPRSRLGDLHRATERPLLVAVADLPQRLAAHAGDEAAARRALVELAVLAEAWQEPTRPLVRGADPDPEHGARVLLADAVRLVLRNGLARLGAAAPERM
ncbi:MAG: anticodon binding domain protein [Humibacillus sp.]|nr:anticodon binding domain protein [Humibacillus sp.]